MKKKIVSAMLIAAMATSMFAGCGSSSEENTTADNNQTAAPAATEAATAPQVQRLPKRLQKVLYLLLTALPFASTLRVNRINWIRH